MAEPSLNQAAYALRNAGARDVPALAALHKASFPRGWPPQYWQTQLEDRRTILRVAALPSGGLGGFVLARRLGDEAEVLSLAVAPGERRLGWGMALLDDLVGALAIDLPCRLLLEVSVENVPAIALYRRAGFEPVGRRKAYYTGGEGTAADALVLALDVGERSGVVDRPHRP